MTTFNETRVDDAALDSLRRLGYRQRLDQPRPPDDARASFQPISVHARLDIIRGLLPGCDHGKADAAVLDMGDAILRKAGGRAGRLDGSERDDRLDAQGVLQAALHTKVRRLRAKYDYPTDLEEQAIELMLGHADPFTSEAA